MIILISGKSGSGKSTLANAIKNCIHFSKHLDIDKINSENFLIEKVKIEAKKIFGENVLDKENHINKKIIKEQIFSCPQKYDAWKAFMEKINLETLNEIIKSSPNQTYIIEHVYAFELSFSNCINILAKVSDEERLKRLVFREKIDEKQLLLRDSKAPNYNEKDFDFVYDGKNFGEILELIQKKSKSKRI
ncbi:MAG: dephospho-CoA kinase [Clostridia bacterium]